MATPRTTAPPTAPATMGQILRFLGGGGGGGGRTTFRASISPMDRFDRDLLRRLLDLDLGVKLIEELLQGGDAPLDLLAVLGGGVLGQVALVELQGGSARFDRR